MANVGSLNVNLKLNTANLAADVRTSVQTIKVIEGAIDDMDRKFARMGGGGGRNNSGFMIQEIGRGVEDMTVNLGNARTNMEGFQMAMRGGANNIASMASMISPMAGGVAAIGIALVSMTLPAIASAIGETKHWREEQERLTQAMKDSVTAAGNLAVGVVGVETQQAKQLREAREKGQLIAPDAARKALEDNNVQFRDEINRHGALFERLNQIMAGPKGKMRDDAEKFARQEVVKSEARIAELEAKGRRLVPMAEAEARKQLEVDAENRRQADKKAIADAKETEKKKREARQAEEMVRQDDELVWQQFLKDEEAKQIDGWMRDNTRRMGAVREQMDAIKSLGLTANGPTAALEAGTAGAFSAVARATMGTATIEDDRKAQLRELEGIHKQLQKANENLSFRKAEL